MKRNYKDQIYMFDGDNDSVYLSNVVTDPDIQVGEHTYYNDFIRDPRDFQKNNVLYHHPEVYHDKIVIGKYCSIACGTKFLCTIAHHSKRSLAYYPFPLAGEHWDLTMEDLDWVDKGPTIVGNDVWFGYDCVIMPGVHIGDGAAIGTRAVVTKDVPPYTVVAGNPARVIKKRFDDKTAGALMELKWWDLPEDELRDLLPDLVYGRLDKVLARKQISDTVREVLSKYFPEK
jgi:virginiamycin A acetyltransferase